MSVFTSQICLISSSDKTFTILVDGADADGSALYKKGLVI